MKKLILFSFAVRIFAFTLTGCDPCLSERYHKGEWYIKNRTDQTVNMVYSLDGRTLTITPNDSIQIAYLYLTGCYTEQRINFYSQFEKHSNNALNFRLFSEGDELLKQWNYSDKDLPGKQFFHESYWHGYELPASDSEPVTAVWIFDILPNDISSN